MASPEEPLSPSAELILLRWMLASELSNVDLATCSNLNRKWRTATQQAILEQAAAAAASATALSRPSSLLLLPSMLLSILVYRPKSVERGIGEDAQPNRCSILHQPQQAETYCAAWFASEGVQQIEIYLKDDDDDGAAANTSSAGASIKAMQHEDRYNATSSNGNLMNFVDNGNIAEPSTPKKSYLTNGSIYKNNVIQQQQQTRSPFISPSGKFVPPGGINHANGDKSNDNNRTSIPPAPPPPLFKEKITNNNGDKSNDRTSIPPAPPPPLFNEKITTNNGDKSNDRTSIPPAPPPPLFKEKITNNNGDKSTDRTSIPPASPPPLFKEKITKKQLIPVCYEWQGYSTAVQVLRPFTYCDSFVNDVLQAAVGRLANKQEEDDDGDELQHQTASVGKDEARDIVIAVRGATTARPESYCQCVDAKQAIAHDALLLNTGSKCHSHIHDHERRQRVSQYLKRIKNAQRDVCPRIVQRRGGTVAVQFLNAAGSHAVCMMTPRFSIPLQRTIITMFCVGIATEDGCFLSGLFRRLELGHLYPHSAVHAATELSAICVASGGDGMVNDAVLDDEQRQQSSEKQQQQQQEHAIHRDDANDCHDGSGGGSGAGGGSYISDRALMAAPPHNNVEDGDGDDDDTNSSCNSSMDHDDDDDNQLISAHHCKCQFQGVCEKAVSVSTRNNDDDEDQNQEDKGGSDDDSVEPPFISRGQTGPGAWHCYTAVIDPFAGTTLIRVDGMQESSSSSSPPQPEGSTTTTNPNVVLDGLTLGSDHNFGMSLCCGGMSDGTGQGALAEVAVFAGRMPEVDVICIERHLMRKHHIVVPRTTTMIRHRSLKDSDFDDVVQQHHLYRRHREDSSKWDREAHALLVVDDAAAMMNQDAGFAGHVPLRYLARHRAVAWRQTDPVTGQTLPIPRIGSRFDAESSDFE